MEDKDLLERYPGNVRHMGEYIEYQGRYVSNIPESDRVSIAIVAELLAPPRQSGAAELLDIGCSSATC